VKGIQAAKSHFQTKKSEGKSLYNEISDVREDFWDKHSDATTKAKTALTKVQAYWEEIKNNPAYGDNDRSIATGNSNEAGEILKTGKAGWDSLKPVQQQLDMFAVDTHPDYGINGYITTLERAERIVGGLSPPGA
jgi:hypothetical protein